MTRSGTGTLALAALLATAPAFAQDGNLVVLRIADPPATNAMVLEATTGPLNVTWGQPAALFKAGEYRVHVADFDANGDGVLTRSEVPGNHALQYEFHIVDDDGNGRVTDAELQADHWQ